MVTADAAVREIGRDTVPAGAWQEPWRQSWQVERREGRDFQVELRDQITGLVDRWQRLAARYGELGAGHEREGGAAMAGLMCMGAVVYDTCAQDLAGLLTGLDRRLSGGYGAGDWGPDREGAA